METRISPRHGQMLIAMLTLGALALIAVTGWYYQRQRASIEAAMNQELAAVAKIEVRQIVHWRRERLASGRALQSQTLMRAAQRVLSQPAVKADDRAEVLDTMRTLEREFGYTCAALVDRNGSIQLQLNTEPLDSSLIGKLGKLSSESSDVTLRDLYWDPKLGRPLMALSVPVQESGAFIFSIDPNLSLYPFIRMWPVPSDTAETILVRIEGDKEVFLNDLRYKQGAALHAWRALSHQPGERTSTSTTKERDYRGVLALRVTRPIPESPWYLVAKIDVSEVDAPLRRLTAEMASIVALIALLSIAGAALIWRDQQLRLYCAREEWLRQMADETPAFLWTTEPDGEGMFINKPLAEFIGGPSNQKLRDTWRTNVHPDDVQRIAESYFACVDTRADFHDEHRLRRFDGEYRWFAARGRARLSQNREFLGYAGALFDITDRRVAEQSARESAELMRAQNRILEMIVRSAPLQEILGELVLAIENLSPEMTGSILLLTPDGEHLCHGAAPNLPDEYTRAIDGEPIGPSAGSCGTAAFRRETVIVEDIATDPLWANYKQLALACGLRACWSTPIFEEKGPGERKVLGTFAFYFHSPRRPASRDLEFIEVARQTAAIAIVRTREADALRRSEERSRLATTYGRLGIWEWQIDSDRHIWTEGLKAIFNRQEQGDLARKNFLEAIHPEDRDRIDLALQTACEAHTDYDVEYRICLNDGSIRWIASHGRAQYDSTNKPIRMLGVARDITRRKLAEEEVSRRDAQLMEANAALEQELKERARTEKEIQALTARLINAQEEERSRLARELHDDLSQQIAALGLALSNLKNHIPPELPDARSQSERVRQKLIHLGEDIRRLSHQLHPAILQYSGVDAALRAYCSEFRALTGIQVGFKAEGSFVDISPTTALCAYRITQEALQNVVKHARAERAEVVLTHVSNNINLTISDSGVGMDLNGGKPNRGLGLTSVRERARLVGGTIDIQSAPGQGTTLAATLPLLPEPADAAPPMSNAASG